MAKNFKIVHMGVGPWRKGDVVSEDHIHDLQGDIKDEADAKRSARNKSEVQRLLKTGAVEETDDDVTIERPEGAVQTPEQTKGDNVDPGSDDDVHKRANRREEAVGKGNTGMPGPGAGTTGEDLDSLTLTELHKLASEANIEGRSQMDHGQLVKALKKQQKK